MIRSSRKNRRPRASVCLSGGCEGLSVLNVNAFDGSDTVIITLSGDIGVVSPLSYLPVVTRDGFPAVVVSLSRTSDSVLSLVLLNPVSGNEIVDIIFPDGFSNVFGVNGALLPPGGYFAAVGF